MSWQPEDHMKLQELLSKAQRSGVKVAMPSSASASVFLDDDDFSLVASEEVQQGSMTDASKRREELFTEGLSAKCQMTKHSSEEAKNQGYSYAMGVPMNAPMPSDPNHFQIELPEGVQDIFEWGRTLICFGQYVDDNLSYMELADMTDRRALSYHKWVRAREHSATGQLQDLAKFLNRLAEWKEACTGQKCVIPGTNLKRVFKK